MGLNSSLVAKILNDLEDPTATYTNDLADVALRAKDQAESQLRIAISISRMIANNSIGESSNTL